MKTRLGSLIQTSSTSGSSRNGWSGPKPETRAISSPTTAPRIGDRDDGTGQAALVVAAYDVLGDAAHERRVALGVDTLRAHLLAHPRIELLDEVAMRVRTRQRHV